MPVETIEFLQRFASPALDRVMLVVTDLGDTQAYIALLVIIYLGIHPLLGRRVGVVLMLSFFLNFHLKGVVATPRPFELDPGVARGEAAVATAPGAGFPSGHAQGAGTFWGYLAVQVRRRGCWLLAVAVVALISISRVYLGVHVPMDIVGGLAIAAGVVAVAWWVERTAPQVVARWPVLRQPRLLFTAGLLAPLALHLLLPVTDSALLTGGLAAFLTAPMLVRYRPPAAVGARVVAAAIGLVLVFAVLLGSSALLPEQIKADPFGGFARYLVLGYVGLALAPYLLQRIGLAPRPEPVRRSAAPAPDPVHPTPDA